jgi:hypothetical protein
MQATRHSFGTAEPPQSGEILQDEVAMAIRLARRTVRPMKRFAFLLRRELGWRSLSRQAIYDWESKRCRVPAEALIGAAKVTGLSLDDLLMQARVGCTRKLSSSV